MNDTQFKNMSAKIGNWLLYGNTGLSSEFMALTALGAEPPEHPNFPHNGGDFDRCFKLVDAIPEIKQYFNVIAQASNEWKVIIDNWDELVETMSSDESVYNHIQRLTKPEEYERNKRSAEKARQDIEAKELANKLEIEQPKTNANGAIIFPRFQNRIVNKWCRDKASKKAVEKMIEDGLLNESDRDSMIEELSDSLEYNHSGLQLFNSLGFADDDMKMIELLELLNSICVSCRYKNYLYEWVKSSGIVVNPTFSIGEEVSFKDKSSTLKTGVIKAILDTNNSSFQPFSYLIDTGDFPKSLIYWDDDSLSRLADKINH